MNQNRLDSLQKASKNSSNDESKRIDDAKTKRDNKRKTKINQLRSE